MASEIGLSITISTKIGTPCLHQVWTVFLDLAAHSIEPISRHPGPLQPYIGEVKDFLDACLAAPISKPIYLTGTS